MSPSERGRRQKSRKFTTSIIDRSEEVNSLLLYPYFNEYEVH